MNNSQTINISTSTIFRVIAILLALVFLYLIRDILLIVFVAVVIASAINGPVSWLQKHRVPRLLGVIFIYLLLLLVLALIITLIFPPLAEQVKQLAANFPDFMEKIGLSVQEWWGKYKIEGDLQTFLSKIGNSLSQATSSVFGTIINLFGGLFSAMIVLVISFYLAVQEKGVKRFLVSLTPQEHQHYLSDLIERIQSKIGSWLRGQLLLMLIIGVLTYVGLYFLGVKYALTLALIACLLEIIPYLGPILAGIPAVILGFTQSPFLALLVIILYIVIQQLENYVIAPQVMKRAVGLSPIIIIIAMLIGAKLAGILGLILSVPVTAAIVEFLKDLEK
ncbi:MAG: AI-2E family transporter [Patescibacteria group bacterium]